MRAWGLTVRPRESCRFCGAPLVWARTESGRAIPLDPSPVDPRTRGALCRIGQYALSMVPATRRVADIFGVDEPTALDRARDEYLWHVAHFATCPSTAREDRATTRGNAR